MYLLHILGDHYVVAFSRLYEAVQFLAAMLNGYRLRNAEPVSNFANRFVNCRARPSPFNDRHRLVITSDMQHSVTG